MKVCGFRGFDPGSCRGMSLVELMIAMGLGLTLMSGILQLYVHNHQLSQQQQVRMRMQETGRFVVSHLSSAVRAAHAVRVEPGNECLVVESRENSTGENVTTQYCIQHRNNDPMNPPSLYMRRTPTTVTPALNAALVDGVAGLSVLYGTGSDGENSVNAWLSAEQLSAAQSVGSVQVISIRVAIFVTSAHGDVVQEFNTTITPRVGVMAGG